MFCENCGSKLPDNSLFCFNCVTSVVKKSYNNDKILDNEIQLRVKPTFKFSYMVLPTIISYTIFILTFCGILIFDSLFVAIMVALICFLLLGFTIGIKVLINKKQYNNYAYDFYKTKIIYKDSFFNLSEKEVKYKYLREVTKRQNFIQRYFNIGNIIILSAADTGYASGICIANVENIDEIYKKIKEIINI